MLKKIDDNRKQIELICLEELVPQDHLVRKLEYAIDFNFIYEKLKICMVMSVEVVLTLYL